MELTSLFCYWIVPSDLAASSAVAGIPPSPGTSSSAAGAPVDKAALAALMPDHAWIETKNKKAALKLEKLDTDLKNYKSNSIKESIRRGHDDLGDHFLDCGDLNSALKCYSRARDYCTSGRHVINMCLNVIKVSVYLQNWSHVVSYVNKALSTPDFSESELQFLFPLHLPYFSMSSSLNLCMSEIISKDFHIIAEIMVILT